MSHFNYLFAEIAMQEMAPVAIVIALYALFFGGLWHTFARAGEPGWVAFVPVYNVILLLRIAERPWWWIVATGLLGPIGFIIFCFVWYEAVKKLNDPKSKISLKRGHLQAQGSVSSGRLSAVIDLPMLVAAALTVLFYVVVSREAFNGTLIHRYTCEHFMEYVVVAFFIWGIVDVVFRVCSFPLEMMALRQYRLSPRGQKEPVQNSKAMYAALLAQPKWFLESRLGQRLVKALGYLQEKESADGFNDYLHYLAVQDDDRTHANYGLVRFICWVAPVLGILGTVIHFGSAFGGLSVDEIGDNLAKVVGEIGTAFNTTTVALAAAITMMLCLFLCERTERGIVLSINRRIDLELQNRFEVVDESLTPFLHAVQSASQLSVQAMASAVEKQLQLWSGAFQQLQQKSEQRLQTHAQLWEQSLLKVHERFEQSDALREQKMQRTLEESQAQRTEHKAHVQGLLVQIGGMQTHFAKLNETLAGILRGEGELVKLQSTLADNVRTLRESQQLDQAMHGLSAAIHLLTARHDLDPKPKTRAA